MWEFPLLFCVVLHLCLPSAYFHPANETCTLQRSDLFPITLEALQVLKFIYKQDRLDFTEDLVTDERDYTISGPVTPRAADELMPAENLRELDELLQNARDTDYN
ncbi:hypothetical protein F4604DRAFT_1576265 [Suillus subluteus]|nr:hypothetical protein F4604DRAFT_1576265 [Suillus subluteus]